MSNCMSDKTPHTPFLSPQMTVIGDRPGRQLAVTGLFSRPDLEVPLSRRHRRKVNAVLKSEGFVDRLTLQAIGDEKADEVGNHHREDDGESCVISKIMMTEVIGTRRIPANAVPMPTSA